MIEYRSLDYVKDVEDVVLLIRQNLDPKYSKEFLLWKHYNNPSGKSIAMVAIEKDIIVGVLFYMRYNFTKKGKEVIRCIRPVDGCTSANQRGKGVFKRLMESCLELYGEHYDLLVATPNKNSFPELIKLGWKSFDNSFIYKIGINLPINIFNERRLIFSELEYCFSKKLNYNDYFVTGNSMEFIKWRYRDKNYSVKGFITNKKSNFIVYRIEKIKSVKSIILCDFIGDVNQINIAVKEICKIERLYFVYYLNNKINQELNFFLKKTVRKAVVVFRENNYFMNEELSISLGDLEGKM